MDNWAAGTISAQDKIFLSLDAHDFSTRKRLRFMKLPTLRCTGLPVAAVFPAGSKEESRFICRTRNFTLGFRRWPPHLSFALHRTWRNTPDGSLRRVERHVWPMRRGLCSYGPRHSRKLRKENAHSLSLSSQWNAIHRGFSESHGNSPAPFEGGTGNNDSMSRIHGLPFSGW